jgi:HK97 family phage portal protein
VIVQSFGTLAKFSPNDFGSTVGLSPSGLQYGTVPWWSIASNATYAAMYEHQPNVRTVVDFIARNIAQLNVQAFRRISDTDRERLNDHDVIGWLNTPNPSTTRYRLIEALMKDLGIYYAAYWLKVRADDNSLIGLVRLPPEMVTPVGYLLVDGFIWTTPDRRLWRLDPADVVYFGNYSPLSTVLGLSPLETLRQTLAEDVAATDYRESFWQNAARLEGVIQRPKDAPKWTVDQKQQFREQWQARFSGPGKAGQTAVLEDGMTFQETSYSARDSEFVASRKLSREECARAYHIPLPMVGILDYATFSNIKEQHKQLYQDSLGPWLEYLEEEFERQLLPESADQADVYLEFNIAAKLAGSFEEQATALQVLVGRPVMTANEGRARLNLPSMKNDPSADELSAPLNTTSGYGGSVKPTAPDVPAAATAAVIRAAWDRQRRTLDKLELPERAAAFDIGRWDRELATDLEPLYRTLGVDASESQRISSALAARINSDTLQLLVGHQNAFSPAREAGLYE